MSVQTALRIALMAAALLLASAPARSQVGLSPGVQTGSPGQTVDFSFGFEGDGSVVAGVGFIIVYRSDAPYIPVNSDGVVECTIDPGAHADEGLPFFDPTRNLFAITFGDYSIPIKPIGKSGTVVRCQVKIKDDAALGTYPLQCRADSATANDAQGNELVATCADGTLHIVAPADTPTPEPTATAEPTATPVLVIECIGDQDGSESVSAAEAARAILAFARRNKAINPAADGDGDGAVSSAEAVRTTLNFAQRQCTL